MKLKQIFNWQFIVAILTLVIIVVQATTGWFMDPTIQIAILSFVNLLFRFVTGQPLKKEVSAIAYEPYDVKKWYNSKMVWTQLFSIGAVIWLAITGTEVPEAAFGIFYSIVTAIIGLFTYKRIV